MGAPQILLLEDDPAIASTVAFALGREGFAVRQVLLVREAHEHICRQPPALAILDVGLPDGNGIDFCARLRQAADARLRALPVLMLTARSEEIDRVLGLERGADDYLTKPFSPRELLARLRALLRRAQAQAGVAGTLAQLRAYRFEGWELNIGLRRLKDAGGRSVELTNGEFSLLVAFLGAARRTLTRDQLLDLSRLHNAEVYDRSIDVQILRLRRKIEANPAQPRFIVTQRGAGYVFDADVEAVR